MQSPSSLIFLVLLGVWAAYFVQYWIRRRDHLATARSVEQFSAAMRVLERRSPIPRTDLSDPAPRSWSVHPARTTRPQVVVKRAVPVEPSAPAASRVVSEGLPGESVRPPVSARRLPTGPAPVLAGPSRRVRASVLLLALLGSLVTGGLVGMTILSAWSLVAAVGVLLASFLWVRAGVRAEQAARAARRRRARDEERRRTTAVPVAGPSRVRRPAAATRPTPDDGVAPAAAVSEPVVTTERPASGDPLEVALATEAPAVSPAPVEPAAAAVPVAPLAEPVAPEPEPEPEPVVEYVHLVDEDDIPLTWDPVPVPRPTYTMKAKAERPEVAPAETTPEPAPLEAPLRAVDERRAAGA